MNHQKIVISSTGNTGILLVNKLFELNYRPENIVVINYKNDDYILENFCKIYNVPYYIIHNDQELNYFVTTNKIDLLINIGGIPYLISQSTLKNVKVAINLHTALTEEYRGRWMASWALINGDTHCGYTWHHINEDFDLGNTILQNRFAILKEDTAFSLNIRIIADAVSNLKYVIDNSNMPGTAPIKPGRYYDKSIPFDGKILDHWSMQQIDRFIRAMYHPPYIGATYQEYEVQTIEQYINLKNRLYENID